MFGGLLLVPGPPGHGVRRPRGAASVNGVVVRDEGALQVVLPVARADHHGRRASSSRTSRRSSASSTRRTIRAAIRASRCSTPASTSARCSPRGVRLPRRDLRLEVRLRRGRHRHAARARAVPVGPEVPARRRRTAGAVEPQPRVDDLWLAILGLLPVAWLMDAVTSIQLGPDRALDVLHRGHGTGRHRLDDVAWHAPRRCAPSPLSATCRRCWLRGHWPGRDLAVAALRRARLLRRGSHAGAGADVGGVPRRRLLVRGLRHARMHEGRSASAWSR